VSQLGDGPPRSSRLIAAWLVPARMASCCCVIPARPRAARISSPGCRECVSTLLDYIRYDVSMERGSHWRLSGSPLSGLSGSRLHRIAARSIGVALAGVCGSTGSFVGSVASVRAAIMRSWSGRKIRRGDDGVTIGPPQGVAPSRTSSVP
jgi:hypothetical protein